MCPQLRIFENQLFINQNKESSGLIKDLTAIRIASFNPILDPWIYILLRKAVVLKLMEKIKCLFCKMGGRGRPGGRHFRCADGPPSSSFASKDSPSLVSREPREWVSTVQTALYAPDRNTLELGSAQDGSGPGSSPAQTLRGSREVTLPLREFSHRDLEDCVLHGMLNEHPAGYKDRALHVTFTDESSNMQEKCI